MGQKHFIVGDGHYVDNPQQADRWSLLLERAADWGCTEVSILGDFFELWLGLSGLERPWQEAFWKPLRALKDRGVRLRYVVGNKDFFVQEWNRNHGLFDDVVAIERTVPSPQGPLVLAHGDLVNLNDKQYRLWRAFSRSWPMRLLAKMLPRRWLGRMSEKAAIAMVQTNRYHKSYFPKEHLQRCAEARKPGDVLVFGHFHVHHDFEHAGVRVITLPFLGAENAGIGIDSEGVHRLEIPST